MAHDGAGGLQTSSARTGGWAAIVASRPRLAALAGGSCIAFSGILFRYSGVTPATATVFRCLYALPWLALLVLDERRRSGGPTRREQRFGILAGVFFALDLLLWHHAVVQVGAGLSTVLANLQVVVVAVLAWVLLGERPARSALLALPFMIAGVVLISGLVGSGAYGLNPGLGVVLGLGSALAYGCYLLVARHGIGDTGRPAAALFLSTATTAVVGAVVGIAIGELDVVPSWPAHGWLAVLGFTSQGAGYFLISASLPRLPAVLTSLILMAQPIMSVCLSFILLSERPSIVQLAGVALIVAGLLVSNADRLLRRRELAGSTSASVEPA